MQAKLDQQVKKVFVENSIDEGGLAMSMNLRTSAFVGRIGWKPENPFGDGVATIGHGRFSWFMGIYLRVMQGLGWIFMMDIQRVVQAPAWCLFLLFGKKHRIHCTLKEPKEIKVWSWRFVSLVSFPADYMHPNMVSFWRIQSQGYPSHHPKANFHGRKLLSKCVHLFRK